MPIRIGYPVSVPPYNFEDPFDWTGRLHLRNEAFSLPIMPDLGFLQFGDQFGFETSWARSSYPVVAPPRIIAISGGIPGGLFSALQAQWQAILRDNKIAAVIGGSPPTGICQSASTVDTSETLTIDYDSRFPDDPGVQPFSVELQYSGTGVVVDGSKWTGRELLQICLVNVDDSISKPYVSNSYGTDVVVTNPDLFPYLLSGHEANYSGLFPGVDFTDIQTAQKTLTAQVAADSNYLAQVFQSGLFYRSRLHCILAKKTLEVEIPTDKPEGSVALAANRDVVYASSKAILSSVYGAGGATVDEVVYTNPGDLLSTVTSLINGYIASFYSL